MMDSSVRESLRAGTWLFLGSITISLTGLLFWLIISRISGAGSIGVASSIFSSAAIASTLVSAGINIGVMREVAARGQRAVTPGLLAALILGLAASTLAIPLCTILGYSGTLVVMAAVFAGLNVTLATLIAILQGLAKFKYVFLVQALSSISKLLLGIELAVLGLGALAAVTGFTIYTVIGVIIALALTVPYIKSGIDWDSFREILRLGYANYPFMLSNRLIKLLTVYLFAFFGGEAVDIGRLYISLMIALAVSGLASSVISASLPIGTRRLSDPYAEAYRLAYGLTLPVIVVFIPFSSRLLALVNQDLASAGSTLTIFLVITPTLVMFATIQARLNRYGDKQTVVILGILRLALLIALSIALVRFGTLGVAVAYLVSTLIATLLGLMKFLEAIRTYLSYQAAVLLPLALIQVGINSTLIAVVGLAMVLIIQEITKTMTPRDYVSTIKEIISVTGLVKTSN